MTLSWGNYPGLSGGANVIATVLKVERLSGLWAQGDMIWEAGLEGGSIAGLGDGGKGAGTKEHSSFCEPEKRRKHSSFFPESPGFSPMRPKLKVQSIKL